MARVSVEVRVGAMDEGVGVSRSSSSPSPCSMSGATTSLESASAEGMPAEVPAEDRRGAAIRKSTARTATTGNTVEDRLADMLLVSFAMMVSAYGAGVGVMLPLSHDVKLFGFVGRVKVMSLVALPPVVTLYVPFDICGT